MEEQTAHQVKKLTQWKNEPTLDELKENLEDAKVFHDIDVNKQTKFMDNLLGKAKHKIPKNRSKVVVKLIRKQAEWRYSSLEAPFLETGDLFNTEPTSADDGPLSDQTNALLNNQFCVQQDLVSFYNKYVRSLVNKGTAVIKVGWSYIEEEYDEEVPEYAIDPITGEPIADEAGNPMIQIGIKTVTKTRVIEDRPTISVVPYENVIFDPTCKGDVEKATFVVEEYESSIAELKSIGGYKNLDKIVFEEDETEAESEAKEKTTFTFKDKPRKRILIREMWLDWDINGDETTKPIVATWAGNVLIRLEENPYPDKKHPYIVTQYLPVVDEICGEPDGVLIEDDQDIASAVTRGMLDIMGRSANGQIGVRSDAMSTLDFIKYQNNQDFRFNPGIRPEEAFFTGKYPEIPNSAYQMVQSANMNAESLTGIQAFNNGMNGSGLGDTAKAVGASMSSAAKRELGILRRMTSSIKKAARKFMSMNAEFLEPEVIEKLTGKQFVPFQDGDISGRLDVKLSISTSEEDNTRASELSFMLQTIGQTIEPELRNMILAKIAKLRKMPEEASKIENWKPAPPDPLDVKNKELTVRQLEVQVEKILKDIEVQDAEEILKEAKAKLEEAKAMKLGSETEAIDHEVDYSKSGQKRMHELEDQEIGYNIEMDKLNHKANHTKTN